MIKDSNDRNSQMPDQSQEKIEALADIISFLMQIEGDAEDDLPGGIRPSKH